METTPTFVRVYLVIAAVALASALLEGVVLTFTGRRDYDWKGSMVSLAIATPPWAISLARVSRSAGRRRRSSAPT